MRNAQGSSFATWTKRLQGKASPSRRRESPKHGFRELRNSDSPSQTDLSPRPNFEDFPTTARDDLYVERDERSVELRDYVEQHATSPTPYMALLEDGMHENNESLVEHVVAKSRSGEDEEENDATSKLHVDIHHEDKTGIFGSVPAYDWATLVLETLAKSGDQNEQQPNDHNQVDHRSEMVDEILMPDTENSTQTTSQGRREATFPDLVIASRGASHEQDDHSVGTGDNVTEPQTIRLVDPDGLTSFKPWTIHSRTRDELYDHEDGENSLLRKKSSVTSAKSPVSSEENVGSRDPEGDRTFVASIEFCQNSAQDEEFGNEATDAVIDDDLGQFVAQGFHESPGLGDIALSVLEPPASSSVRGGIEDGELTIPAEDKVEGDIKGDRGKNTNSHTLDHVVDSSVQSQASENSSALEDQKQALEQIPKPEIQLSSNTRSSKTSKKFQPDQSDGVKPAGRIKTAKKPREKGARVKLKSKPKNKAFLVGVGEIITSALSSDRRAPVAIDYPGVQHRSEALLDQSSAQRSQVTDPEANPREDEQSSHDKPYLNDDKVVWSDDRVTSEIEIIASESIALAVTAQENEDIDAVTMTDFNSERERNDKSRKTSKRDKANKPKDKDLPGKTKDGLRRRRDKGKRKGGKRSKKSLVASSSDVSDAIEHCACQEAVDDGAALCNAIAVDHNGGDGGCRDITYDLREMAIEFVKKGPGVVIKWLE